jgi:hypothetical protein
LLAIGSELDHQVQHLTGIVRFKTNRRWLCESREGWPSAA